jgi:SPW repeat.
MQAKRWTLGILGLWIILAAFLTLGTSGHLWNDVIVGALVAVVSLSVGERGAWSWFAALVGVWLIVAGFIPALVTGAGLIWNNVIVGAIVATTGLALGSQKEPQAKRGAAGATR